MVWEVYCRLLVATLQTCMSLVDGVVGVCVFGEYQTQLILKGVTRQTDGYTVTCTVLYGIFFIVHSHLGKSVIYAVC